MRFSDFLLVSDPADLDFIVGYSGEQNIRIDVADFIAGNITGSGNAGYIPVFTSEDSIGNSQIFQDGSNIVIGGVNAMGYRLAVGGSLYALGGTTIESVIPGSDTFRTIGEEGDSFIIPNDQDESIWTSRRIIHAPAVLTTESATLGQLNTAISNLEGDIELLLDLKVDKTSIGAANGVASLDSGGKVPLSQIPDSIIGQVEYMGTWNAFTNTPTLNPLVPEEKGHYYVVSVAGVFGGVDYQVGDWIISNGIEWQKVDNTDAVTSVFGRIGAILALEADYQSFYPRLSQAYDNPTWINTLAFSKITGVPPFLLENQTITLSGDVTGSGKTSISSTISNNAITDSKLRDSVGTSVIGRASSTTGDPADIQATTDGHVLQRSGGSLLFGLISSDSIGSIDWSKIINTPTTLSGYGITNAYTKTEADNKFVPYTGANANVNLGSNNITANAFVKAGGTSAQFLKADGSVDTSQYVPTTRSINAGTGLTGGGNLSSDVTLSFDTTWGDTRYAYRTRQLTINGVAYDLSADRTWIVGTVNTLTTNGTSGPATLVGNTLNIPNYTTDLSGYVTLATDQAITGLKTIVRSGDVLNFKIGTDTLYGLKLFYSQNEISPNGEATWSFVNTFNRDGIGYEVTPISFFRGVLVTGERLVTSSINTNLLDYYANNPTGRYPVYTYNTGVQQFANAIVVGETNGIVNPVSGVISDLPSGVVANFKGRVIGSNAVNSNEFVTLSQLPSLTGYVPYNGATQNVNLGEYGLSGGYFQADLTPTQAAGVGRLIWNNSDGTLNLGLLGGNVNLHLGQQQYSRVVNGTGSNRLRANYQVVKIIGAQGQRVQVGLARADNDANSKDTLGLIAENINNNQEGFIISNGILDEINTTGSLQGETWNDGDTLYLSGSIYGQLTNIKPSAPIHTVIVGFVAYAHANNGKIFVKVDNGYELEELHDVNPLPYVNNGLLYRDTATNLWKSATISTILGYTPAPQGNYITALTGEATASGPGSVNITLSNSAVTGKVLTGLNVTGNAISSTDSILTAFGKLQNQVNQLVGGLQYEGTWNASTNTPTITSSVGTDGTFYIVSVAGTTNINGINDWQVGDWIVFHDTSWQKVDNTDSITSVFGRVGNIVANQSDYSAFYPLISDIKDGILTVQGTGVLSGSGTFSANQATNNTITLTHAAVSRTDTTSSQAPSFGGSFTVVDSITSSAQGHITAINTKTVTIPSTIATSTQTGLLSNTDWTTFNSKQNAITLTTTGTSGAATLVGSTLNIPQYQAAGTYVTGVTATSPLFSSGGTTPNITIQQSGTSASGFLSSTDWNTFNNKANANGSNASGTWGINITGSAGSAGSASTASLVNGTSGGAIQSWDIRTISPSSMTAARFGFGFTSWNNNNTSPWADYLHLRSYSDGSGGSDNLVMFLKSGIGMRIYQQTFGSSSAYSSFKDVAWTDGTNSSGTWGISITGNATTSSNSTQWGGYSLPTWTNWSSRGSIDIVVGQLGWKNYGNNHVIFDASNSTSPSGASVNNTNSAVAWSATYPTLMGWNGSTTYGVRVDSARVADSAGSASSVPWSGVTSKPSYLMYYQGFTLDANTMDTNSTGFTYSVNAPYTGPIARFSANGGYDLWINSPYGGDGYGFAFRTRNGDAGTFNSWKYPAIYGINVNGGGALYASIYYDQNDTGFYVDPNSTSVQSRLTNIGLLGSNSSNARNHFVQFNSGTASPSGGWIAGAFGDASANRVVIGQWGSTTQAIIGSHTGSLNDWAALGYVATEHIFYAPSWNTGEILKVNTNGIYASILYDSNNTAYYVNPAGTSYVSGEFAVQQSSISGIRLISNSGVQSLWVRAGYDTDGSATPVSSPTNIQFQSSGNSGGTFTFVTGNTRALTIVSDYAQGSGSLRAPIFYDLNDTFYFVDPNSTSRLSTVTAYGEYGSYRNDTQSLFRSYNTSAGSPLQFYLDHNFGNVNIGNSRGVVFAGGTYWEIANSVRSPIFYDSNNTGFYVDPTSTTWLNEVYSYSYRGNGNVGGTGNASWHPSGIYCGGTMWQYGDMYKNYTSIRDAQDIYNHGWYRNYGRVGMYSQSYGLHFYPSDSFYWSCTGSGGSTFGIQFRSNYDSTVVGYVYGDTGGSFGLLWGGGWAVRTFSGGGELSGTWTSTGDHRAPIFYDSTNTAYYAAPAATSRMLNLLLGGASATGFNLNITGNAQIVRSGTSAALIVGLSGVTGSVIRFSYNGGFVGSISTDGSNTAYNTSSDYRLKEDIVPIENPVSKILSLNPVNFKYKSSKTRQDGFLAHELKEVLPYLVVGEKDAVDEDGNPVYQEVDYSKLTPILIAAIKELKTEIETLKTQL